MHVPSFPSCPASAGDLLCLWYPCRRRVELAGGKAVLFTDTVGFIQKLPTQVGVAFLCSISTCAAA